MYHDPANIATTTRWRFPRSCRMMAVMKTFRLITLCGAPGVAAILLLLPDGARADEFTADEHQRQTVYHSPQKPGFTSWVGAWLMPDGSVMTSFTQATSPLKDLRAAPKDVQEKLNGPPKGSPGYEMTGTRTSVDSFQSCMNGVTGEAEAALAAGTILRGVSAFICRTTMYPCPAFCIDGWSHHPGRLSNG